MKVELIFKIFFTLFCFFSVVNAQQVSVKPFSVTQSNLINDLKATKSSNPKLTTDELVKTGNLLLDKQGINFIVAFDANTCQKISQAIANLKDKTAPLNLRTALKSPL
jgi:predicted sulfurtransferase